MQMPSQGCSENHDRTASTRFLTSLISGDCGGTAACGGRSAQKQHDRDRTKPMAPLAPLAKQPMAPLEQDRLRMRRSHSDSTISSPSPPNDLVVAGAGPLTSAGPGHETQSLHATCASSTTSSTFVNSTNAGRSGLSAGLRHHHSPPQSEAPGPSIDHNTSSIHPGHPGSPPHEFQQCPSRSLAEPHDPRTAAQCSKQSMEPALTSLHRHLCHPAICSALLILHIMSLSTPSNRHEVTRAMPLTQILWTTLHLISFCSNLLIIQLDTQTASAAAEVSAFSRPDPCRLACLACTVPGAVRVLLAVLRWPVAAAPMLALPSSTWALSWLETAVLIAAALLNASYALSAALVPLRGAARRLSHTLALGAGAAVLLSLTPPLLQPPAWAAVAAWFLVRPSPPSLMQADGRMPNCMHPQQLRPPGSVDACPAA